VVRAWRDLLAPPAQRVTPDLLDLRAPLEQLDQWDSRVLRALRAQLVARGHRVLKAPWVRRASRGLADSRGIPDLAAHRDLPVQWDLPGRPARLVLAVIVGLRAHLAYLGPQVLQVCRVRRAHLGLPVYLAAKDAPGSLDLLESAVNKSIHIRRF